MNPWRSDKGVKMESITLGQLAAGAAFLVALITAISALMNQMKKWILSTVKSEVDRLDGKIDAQGEALQLMEKNRMRDNADNARRGILTFNDELLRGKMYSIEAFDQTLRDIDAYEHYSNAHPDYPNNQAMMAIANIKRCYQRCTEEKTFLS